MSKPPPFTDSTVIDYEKQLLGNYIFGAPIGENITESVFCTTGHRTIFPVIRELKENGLDLDIQILVGELKKRNLLDEAGGVSYVADLTTAVISIANAQFYESEVLEAHRGRSLYRAVTIAKEAVEKGKEIEVVSETLDTTIKAIVNGRAGESKSRAIIKRFSEIPPSKPEWLWEGHIPRGMFVIIGGDPGQGKSAVGLDIAARVSAGLPFIYSLSTTHEQPGDVLIAAGEDVPEITISPRLRAMEANLNKVFYLYGREGKDNKEIPWGVNDIATLKDAIRQIKDNGGLLKLFIIDPLEYFIGGDVDTYRNNEVRAALKGIMDLAKDENFTILAIQHLNKNAGTQSLYRIAGSIAFAAAARTVWVVTKEKDSPNYLFANSKMNIAKKAPTYRYSIVDVDGIGIPAWEGIADTDAETAMNGQGSRASGKPAHEQEKVLEIIKNRYPQDIKFAELAELTGKAPGNLGNMLKDLENLGLIEKQNSKKAGYYIWIKPQDDLEKGKNSSSFSENPIGKKEEEEKIEPKEELEIF